MVEAFAGARDPVPVAAFPSIGTSLTSLILEMGDTSGFGLQQAVVALNYKVSNGVRKIRK